MNNTRYVYNYSFTGPYSVSGSFKNVAGVYIISTTAGTIVDVGETDALGDRIVNHDRKNCWSRNSGTQLWFHSNGSKESRLTVESTVRNNANPACGVK